MSLKKIFGSKKNFMSRKKFGSKKLLGQKTFGYKVILGRKKIGEQRLSATIRFLVCSVIVDFGGVILVVIVLYCDPHLIYFGEGFLFFL